MVGIKLYIYFKKKTKTEKINFFDFPDISHRYRSIHLPNQYKHMNYMVNLFLLSIKWDFFSFFHSNSLNKLFPLKKSKKNFFRISEVCLRIFFHRSQNFEDFLSVKFIYLISICFFVFFFKVRKQRSQDKFPKLDKRKWIFLSEINHLNNCMKKEKRENHSVNQKG